MLLMTNRVMMSLSVNIYIRVKKNERIQFRIIHLKSKTNREETADATEELCNLNKNNGAGTSGDSKKRARTFFGTSY